MLSNEQYFSGLDTSMISFDGSNFKRRRDGQNWYNYVSNNPLRFTDSTGLRIDDDLKTDLEHGTNTNPTSTTEPNGPKDRDGGNKPNNSTKPGKTPVDGTQSGNNQTGLEKGVKKVLRWLSELSSLEEIKLFKELTKDQSTVHSAYDGVVKYAGFDDNVAYYVSIKNSDGTTSLYVHLDPVHTPPWLKKGQQVQENMHIGFIANPTNGLSTDPHLHYELRNENNEHINPGDDISRALPGLSRVTSPYGYRTNPFTKEKKFHTGIDAVGVLEELNKND